MNILNNVSRLTSTPPPSPPRSRTSSSTRADSSSGGQDNVDVDSISISEKIEAHHQAEDADVSEKTSLLDSHSSNAAAFKQAPGLRIWEIPQRVANAILSGVKVVFTTITAPGRYVIASFYDEQGHFSAVMPLRNLKGLFGRRKRRVPAQAMESSLGSDSEVFEEKRSLQRRSSKKRSPSVDSTASTASAASSEGDDDGSPAKRTRSKTAAQHGEEGAQAKKGGRVKLLHNDEALQKRKSQRSKQSADPSDIAKVAGALKSPSSPAGTKLTRYPRAPAPPRPLVPRRQPSYTLSYNPETPKKTLIIDLDETLIHSMAKGGRMSTGHMVEVRLGGPVSSSGVQLGSGVPILYYVHERPGCHEFLRKVCKWFNLIVFTASVQEYADPVIDWLERERKYFSRRYYRQHCTFRNGAYIKDLAQVEPDLSKVMILDNSPMSYIFHEDNAIPIEGWISDPTDLDLLHLVPLLEGLQYVTDVRALLALRQGQAQQA